MIHPDVLLTRLAGVKPNGDGRWLARCPAHDDTDPSLSIRHTHDGRILVNCFAGCDVEDVMTAVGLHTSDLYQDKLGGEGAPITLSWSRTTSASPEKRSERLDRTLRAFRMGKVSRADAEDMDTYAMTYVDLCVAMMKQRKKLDPDSPEVVKRCQEWLKVRGIVQQSGVAA